MLWYYFWMHHIIARKVATNSMSYPSENLWKPLTQILYNGYFGSEYPAIKYVRSGYNTHTPLSNSKAHVVLLGKGNNCLWRQGRLKLCHCLCLARLFGKKKSKAFFALKFLTPSVGAGTRDKALRPSAQKAKTRKTFSMQNCILAIGGLP